MKTSYHPSRIFTLKLAFLILLQWIVAGTAFGQNTGDYQTATTGNWKSLTTWLRYDGFLWATPSASDGWPGQHSGMTYGDITIQPGHVVTIGTEGITTWPMESITIQQYGKLYLTGTNATVTFSLNTSVIDIQQDGQIFFYKKSKLVLITDAVVTLVIGQNGLVADVCNNNAEFFIGTQKYAVCAGAPGDIFTFDQLNAAGGTLNAIPASNSPLCQGSTITLSGNYTGAIGTTPNYAWLVTAPGGGNTSYNSEDVSIPEAVIGTYIAKLTVTTVLNGTTYTNSDTIHVTVNPLPTLTGVAQPVTVCDEEQATIQLSGLVPGTTFTVNYKIDNVSQTPIPGLVATTDGTSGVLTPGLDETMDGKTLEVTGITITSSPSNCSQTFTTQNTTPLSVWTTGPGTWIGITSSDWNTPSNWCGNAVPVETTDVYIPPPSISVPNQPVIDSLGGWCHNLTIGSTAFLTIENVITLSVHGNWINSGAFIAGTATVTFAGSDP
ncbi:MAG: hypothetical protein PHD25_11630 [Bacteroidales bacterium]|nr:hypothetical protein [Bacteroidales bacterium]